MGATFRCPSSYRSHLLFGPCPGCLGRAPSLGRPVQACPGPVDAGGEAAARVLSGYGPRPSGR